jgi:hypothetical protein
MLGFLPPPYHYRCRLRAFYPLPVVVRRAKNPRISKSAPTPPHPQILAFGLHKAGLRPLALPPTSPFRSPEKGP